MTILETLGAARAQAGAAMLIVVDDLGCSDLETKSAWAQPVLCSTVGGLPCHYFRGALADPVHLRGEP